MIIVISNRNINPDYNNEYLFGEFPNEQGGDTVRIAKADYKEDTRQWSLELISEDDGTNLPSKELFEEIATGISSGIYKRNWVFYIPGYNQSSRSALDASWQISDKYEVDIVLFSWPSNPGVFIIEEYPEAIEAAKISAQALRRTFKKLDTYMKNCPLDSNEQRRISLNLLIHSLGNFVVENYVRSYRLLEINKIFQNTIFHQADVDNKGHKEWIDNINFGRRIYVTLNKHDYVLTGSGAFHLDRLNAKNVNNRLGNKTKKLTAQKPIYVDFTNGIFVANAHNLFLSVDNAVVETFFKQVLRGGRGEDSRTFEFDSRINAYILNQGI